MQGRPKLEKAFAKVESWRAPLAKIKASVSVPVETVEDLFDDDEEIPYPGPPARGASEVRVEQALLGTISEPTPESHSGTADVLPSAASKESPHRVSPPAFEGKAGRFVTDHDAAGKEAGHSAGESFD